MLEIPFQHFFLRAFFNFIQVVDYLSFLVQAKQPLPVEKYPLFLKKIFAEIFEFLFYFSCLLQDPMERQFRSWMM